jgi:hypothetical protein
VFSRTVATSIIFLLSSTAFPADSIDKLTSRLPQGANTIIVADVGYLLEGPEAGQMRWVVRGADSGAPPLLPAVAGINHACLGASLDFASLHPDWEIAILEVGSSPSMEQMARSIGGYTDTIEGTQGAWSPAGACYLALDSKTVVSAQPANRQWISTWIVNARSTGGIRSSAYLRNAAMKVSNRTPIILAIDLHNAFAFPSVLRWLRVDSNDAVARAMTDRIATARALTAVQGVTIQVSVGSATTAVITVDFDTDTAILAPLIKPLFLELLSDHGLTLPDMNQWTFAVSGRTVTSEGPLSDQGLRTLLSLLQAPSPQPVTGGSPQSSSGATESMATASTRYFRQVSSILENIGVGGALNEQSGWLWRDATRVDQLPAMNVDPELLRWGSSVSANLRQASSILEAGQQRVIASARSAQAPVASYSNDDSGNGDAQYQSALENYRRQIQRSADQIRAQVTQEANKPIQAAIDSRGQIRATMAGRYPGEF